jgi:hypothetical protein
MQESRPVLLIHIKERVLLLLSRRQPDGDDDRFVRHGLHLVRVLDERLRRFERLREALPNPGFLRLGEPTRTPSALRKRESSGLNLGRPRRRIAPDRLLRTMSFLLVHRDGSDRGAAIVLAVLRQVVGDEGQS